MQDIFIKMLSACYVLQDIMDFQLPHLKERKFPAIALGKLLFYDDFTILILLKIRDDGEW